MTHRYAALVARVRPDRHVGSVRKIAPGRIEAAGPYSAIGDICEIGDGKTIAEVAAVSSEHIILIPLDESSAILPGARVTARPANSSAAVGDVFAGRAVDALGRPIDGKGAIRAFQSEPLSGQVLAPLDRQGPISRLVTGIRAIDGLLTLARGQRLGVFSASGVGKTTLITQIAAQIECDHCVMCLVGERGCEVESIWRQLSQLDSAARYTCVAATSDLSAPLRVRALHQALALCEHWRSTGKHVVLIVDSITRYAMALREIGLAAGAPPTLRAYTPNVLAALPRVVERCGAAAAGGSITAVMTVLSETDDVDDPIVEVMKALLDGHIVLSRHLAEQGQFPAIDVIRSVSRLSDRLMTSAQAQAARRAVSILSAYEDSRVMIDSGIYQRGANAQLDEAIVLRDGLLGFLRQACTERTALIDTLNQLQSVTAKHAIHA